MRTHSCLALAVCALGCYSTPLPSPDADTPDAGPCSGACGAGTMCVEGACVVVDAGMVGMDAGIDAGTVVAVDLGAPVDVGVDVPAVDVGVDTGPVDALPAGCLSTTTGNCCGVSCPAPANGTALCGGGRCGIANCVANYGDCDGNAANGCEVDLRASAANCGACGAACAAGRGCVAGACVEVPPSVLVGSYPFRVGACERCSVANATCVCGVFSGWAVYTCLSGYAECDGMSANGCEARLASSAMNCGRCGNACPGGTACVNATCR